MINTKELRIGNLVNAIGTRANPAYYTTGIVEVEMILPDGINLTHGDLTAYGAEHIEGIPLTPEWLENMGFEQYYENPRLEAFFVNTKGYYPFLINRTRAFQFFYNENLVIENVHQLQNLYFALTGDELEIKPL